MSYNIYIYITIKPKQSYSTIAPAATPSHIPSLGPRHVQTLPPATGARTPKLPAKTSGPSGQPTERWVGTDQSWDVTQQPRWVSTQQYRDITNQKRTCNEEICGSDQTN